MEGEQHLDAIINDEAIGPLGSPPKGNTLPTMANEGGSISRDLEPLSRIFSTWNSEWDLDRIDGIDPSHRPPRRQEGEANEHGERDVYPMRNYPSKGSMMILAKEMIKKT